MKIGVARRSTRELDDITERFRAPLLAFFMRRIGDRATAEDLTQDTFVRMLTVGKRENIEDVGALLFKIAGNLLRDEYRKTKRARHSLAVGGGMAWLPTSDRDLIESISPERIVLDREALAMVSRALTELSERRRTMYVLFRLENIKQCEIANLFGVSKSTVEKEINNAAVHVANRLRGTGA